MQTLDMLHQHYFQTMGPMISVTITAFVVMILEFSLKRHHRTWLVWPSIVGLIVAIGFAAANYHTPPKVTLNTIVVDPIGTVFSLIILVAAILVLVFSFDYARRTHIVAEHTYLILFAVVGALAMATAVDFVTLYVGLELLSVSSYVLVAIRRKSVRSVEAGAKYLIMGSIGSAVLLYGISFLYGVSGTTNLIEIGVNAQDTWSNSPAVVTMAFVLILSGMGVKLSVVPFHMWTPDAYDGAPSPVSAFLATLSKIASFTMLLRILLYAFGANTSELFYWLGALAVITMIVGNLIALPQRNMKRLLAFSSIAQAGYVLVPFALFGASPPPDWYGLLDTIAFYLLAYLFVTVGAFAIVHLVSRERQTMDSDALVGLYQRSPWLATALTVFVLSLAGMPLTGGFIGKLYIFTDTLHMHNLWMGIVLFTASVVSFYYYFGWIRKMFQRELGIPGGTIKASGVMQTFLAVCVVVTLVLGVVPASAMHTLLVTKWF